MLKKRNLIFICLLILGVFLITSCLPKPPVTEGILKGQVLVPEGSVQAKQLTGQALPDATVNIIDPATGAIIATTTTDADGYYQVFVPAGGPYLLEALKDGVKLQQFTPQVEVGIEYDLGTADCSTTTVALIAQAMLDAEDYPDNLADINLADIETDPDFDDVMSDVCSKIAAGEDLAESALVQQAVEDFLHPPATVTFNSQGGSAVNSQTVEQGGKVTEPADPTRKGYTFGGWYKKSGCANAWDFTNDTVISNITLYAKWTINTYTVTFNKNDAGATGSMSAQTIASGSSAALTACAFTKTGWTFAGWAETEDGAVDYADGASYTMGVSNVTLYAKWTINTYTLTMSKTGSGTGTTIPTEGTHTYDYGTSVTISASPASSSTFTGWSGDATGTSNVILTMTENKSVTATFTLKTYTITATAESNGTIDPSGATTVNHGANQSFTITAATNYHIADVLVDGSSVGAVGTYTFTNVTTTHTIAATFTINSYTITFDENDAGATGTMADQTIASGSSANLTVCTFTRIGYTFAGWATTSGGTVVYGDEESYTMGTADVTLHAKWYWTAVLNLRDTGPAGGLIFYINPNYTTDGWRYLEAAPNDQDYVGDYTVVWGCEGTIILDADGTAVGTGKQNTDDILAGCATSGIAAYICADLSFGGYSDWFLPSKGELQEIWWNLVSNQDTTLNDGRGAPYAGSVGGFAGSKYWSSSEHNELSALHQDFDNGFQNPSFKSEPKRVRAVRRF